MSKHFAIARRAAGVGTFRLHDLRHFMATQMLHAEIPVQVVSRRLAHSRVSTTFDYYTHAIPAYDRAAADTLATIVRRAAG